MTPFTQICRKRNTITEQGNEFLDSIGLLVHDYGEEVWFHTVDDQRSVTGMLRLVQPDPNWGSSWRAFMVQDAVVEHKGMGKYLYGAAIEFAYSYGLPIMPYRKLTEGGVRYSSPDSQRIWNYLYTHSLPHQRLRFEDADSPSIPRHSIARSLLTGIEALDHAYRIAGLPDGLYEAFLKRGEEWVSGHGIHHSEVFMAGHDLWKRKGLALADS